MSKVLMLFLFISFSSFSQSISFDDIKTINSQEKLDIFRIENGLIEAFARARVKGEKYYHLIKEYRDSDRGGGDEVRYGLWGDEVSYGPWKANEVWYSKVPGLKYDLIFVGFLERLKDDFKMHFRFYMCDDESPSDCKNRGETITDDYKFILNQVKSQCNFYGITSVTSYYHDPVDWDAAIRDPEAYRYSRGAPTNELVTDYSCYTCPSSKDIGKICFTKGEIIINDKFLSN